MVNINDLIPSVNKEMNYNGIIMVNINALIPSVNKEMNYNGKH